MGGELRVQADDGATRAALSTVLAELCRELTGRLGATGCAISRAIGEMLVLVAQHAPDGRSFQTGHGYLIPDYPETAFVLETGQPRSISTQDADANHAETGVLKELKVTSVLMLALGAPGSAWGLVEIYRAEGRFSPDEEKAAQAIVSRAAARLEQG